MKNCVTLFLMAMALLGVCGASVCFAGDPAEGGDPALCNAAALLEGASLPLNAEEKRQILWYLRRGALEKPSTNDQYWNEFLRDEERARNHHADETQGRGRRWFFPEGPLGQKTFEFLDMSALGFRDSSNDSNRFKGTTLGRVVQLRDAPWTDPQELRIRQGGMREIMVDRPGLLTQLQEIFKKPPSHSWAKRYFDGYRGARLESPDVFNHSMAEIQLYGELRRNPNDHEKIKMDEYVVESVERRRQFFRDAVEALGTLSTYNVQSLRLRQLKWAMESVVNDASADGSGTWIQKFIDSKELLTHEDLLERSTQDGKLKRRLDLLIEAFTELLMYTELAEHAMDRGWNTFAEILDPNETGGPVLSIEDGHAPRIFAEARENSDIKSIPNSIELGVNGKRHMVITGPNNHGKTTMLRLIAQLITLTEMGLPVPALRMKVTPLGLCAFMHPKDDPARKTGLFKAEGRELLQGVYKQALRNPFQLVLMDEIAPGANHLIREDVESVYLEMLDKTGVLSITTTHNFGTIALGENPEGPFINMHMSKHHLLPGANTDLGPMYDSVAQELLAEGWPPEAVAEIRRRGKLREAQQQNQNPTP